MDWQEGLELKHPEIRKEIVLVLYIFVIIIIIIITNIYITHFNFAKDFNMPYNKFIIGNDKINNLKWIIIDTRHRHMFTYSTCH